MSSKPISAITRWEIKLFDLRGEFLRAMNARDHQKADDVQSQIAAVERHIERLHEVRP